MEEILRKADEANLVIQPSNSLESGFICCCCGCCCGILKGLQAQDNPSAAVAGSFIAELKAELCQGCWVCIERCQMGAFVQNDECVDLNSDRCIGCGLCVSTCPSGALTLVRKQEINVQKPPKTMDATWRMIASYESGMNSI